MNTTRFLAIFAAVRLCFGQTPADEAARQKKAAESMHAVASSLLRSAKVILDKPYSADTVTRTVQTLADGNTIVRENSGRIYRDRSGRTRREQKIEAMGPSSPMAVGSFIVISDPVAKTDFILDPARKSLRKFERLETGQDTPKPLGAPRGEDLGERTIEGLVCHGERRTTTIPAGQMGNARPLSIVSETWYSSAIDAIVQSTTHDPRFGDTAYTLRNVTLAEPPANVFHAPADYTIEFEGRRAKP